MRIRWNRIAALILLIFAAVIVIRVLPAISQSLSNLGVGYSGSSSSHSQMFTPESVSIITLGFLLIAALGALRLLLQHMRQDRKTPRRHDHYFHHWRNRH